jgi:hypothetical protein
VETAKKRKKNKKGKGKMTVHKEEAIQAREEEEDGWGTDPEALAIFQNYDMSQHS